jgi:hypothetical protein
MSLVRMVAFQWMNVKIVESSAKSSNNLPNNTHKSQEMQYSYQKRFMKCQNSWLNRLISSLYV